MPGLNLQRRQVWDWLGIIIESVSSILFLSQHECWEANIFCVLEFLELVCEILIHENHRGYKELLVGEGKTIGVAKVSTQIKFEMDEHGSTVQMKLLRILESLNVLARENILLSINTKNAAWKVAFNLVNTC